MPSKLADWLSFIGIETCPCRYEWKGLGVLHGVNMGKGWVRMTTEPSCPHHGVNRPPLEPVPDD